MTGSATRKIFSAYFRMLLQTDNFLILNMDFYKTTEEDSHYASLEQMSVDELLTNINTEDKTVPLAVEKALPQLKVLVEMVIEHLKKGGRLFYIGAGTSGRLGILDASECPPTFGAPSHQVIGIIAGGDTAIRKAVEFAEDSLEAGWNDLQAHQIGSSDVVIGIAASGTTPYVLGAIEACNLHGIATGCITCNRNSPLARLAHFPVEIVVGPEFVTGSSRMKAGTAQKLALNMISTTTMIQLGRVKGSKMVDMQLSNQKLIERGVRMITAASPVSGEEAERLLLAHGSVRNALEFLKNRKT
jgi:N-acetylmuramic acid 6-phosphate etherase